jgi:rhodanese-related sulfurtransferase
MAVASLKGQVYQELARVTQAISIPLAQLKKRLKELPKNKTIIAYCRGPLCVMAIDAIKLLNQNKFTAIRMDDGYVEWKL